MSTCSIHSKTNAWNSHVCPAGRVSVYCVESYRVHGIINTAKDPSHPNFGPPRPSHPNFGQVPWCSLNPVVKCHTCLVFNNCDSTTSLSSLFQTLTTFCEEIVPNIQLECPLMHLEAGSSYPITWKKTQIPTWAPTSFQVIFRG